MFPLYGFDFNTYPIICDVHQPVFEYYNVIIMKLYNDSVIIFERIMRKLL